MVRPLSRPIRASATSKAFILKSRATYQVLTDIGQFDSANVEITPTFASMAQVQWNGLRNKLVDYTAFTYTGFKVFAKWIGSDGYVLPVGGATSQPIQDIRQIRHRLRIISGRYYNAGDLNGNSRMFGDEASGIRSMKKGKGVCILKYKVPRHTRQGIYQRTSLLPVTKPLDTVKQLSFWNQYCWNNAHVPQSSPYPVNFFVIADEYPVPLTNTTIKTQVLDTIQTSVYFYFKAFANNTTT